MLNFKDFLEKYDNKPVIVLGAGLVGHVITNYLKQKKIKVKFVIDNNLRRQNQKLNDIKIVSSDYLNDLDKETKILIAHRYFDSAIALIQEKKFNNFFSCHDLMSKIDQKIFYKGNMPTLKVERLLNYYVLMANKKQFLKMNKLYLKSIDVQVSEKCSLKCADCCNLMQYYKKPKDVETDILIRSIDKFMECVDGLDEFRVLGGDPFMNKDLHIIMKKLISYEKCKKIVVYTNARFLPKGENLDCLKNEKVILEITDYGEKDSKAAKQFIDMAKRENVAYQHSLVSTWDDAGKIMPYINRSESDLKNLFTNCCQQDLISMLHGKIYRCPFSANAANLNAIPEAASDEVNLLDEKLSIKELRERIKQLCFDKEFLTACSYCKGRTYESEKIKSAIQTKTPLQYNEFKENKNL